jgi:molybdenum cofactor cytidylyltransferase
MKAQAIDVRHSVGRVLFSTIFHSGGKKLLSKGHRIEPDDVLMLQTEAMNEVWVAEIEVGDISEDEAVMQVASQIGNGSLEIRLAAGGRANLFATEPCCVLVDSELLEQSNSADGLVIATSRNFSYARAGQRVSTIKSAPFAVTQPQVESLLSLLAQKGPILQARPIRTPVVVVLYTDPVSGDRAAHLFGTTIGRRLERLGSVINLQLSSVEEEGAVADALQQLLRSKPTVILVASTMAPAGPYDIVGRAMIRAGCQIERFLAPVEPGTLLLVGYRDDVPILSAPGCFRSAKPNVLDLVLPPMLAKYRLSTWDIASLGQGGLLDGLSGAK